MNIILSNNCHAHRSPSFENQCDEDVTSFPSLSHGG